MVRSLVVSSVSVMVMDSVRVLVNAFLIVSVIVMDSGSV